MTALELPLKHILCSLQDIAVLQLQLLLCLANTMHPKKQRLKL